MSTIKDVGTLAGVSVATVSRVLNNSEKVSPRSKKAVLKAIEELGYRPNLAAQSLAKNQTNTIGVLVGDVSDPFFGAMLKSIETVAYSNGKQVLIGNGFHDEKREKEVVDLLINYRCDAIVVHSKALSDKVLLDLAQEIPNMVILNRIVPGLEARCISLNNEHGSYLATSHLLAAGHKEIGFLASDHHIEDNEQRKSGYLRALKEFNISAPEEWISEAAPSELGGEEATQDLLSRSLSLTAIVCYNDIMAAGAMTVLNDNGFDVPKDISLVGFDDSSIARYLSPKLTTVKYPIAMMATIAAKLSINLCNGKLADAPPLFTPVLIKRQSTSEI